MGTAQGFTPVVSRKWPIFALSALSLLAEQNPRCPQSLVGYTTETYNWSPFLSLGYANPALPWIHLFREPWKVSKRRERDAVAD